MKPTNKLREKVVDKIWYLVCYIKDQPQEKLWDVINKLEVADDIISLVKKEGYEQP